MAEDLRVDLCVVGAGAAGLSVAAGASQMGASVVLIERGKMGGECLNVGCVPSKALLAAGHAAAAVRGAGRFGIRTGEPQIDMAAVHAHVRGVIAGIAPMDSAARYAALGVRVIQAEARFVDRETMEADGRRIHARRFVLATGSHPDIPDVPGLAETPYLTNETVFDLTECPAHLVILGGGPIGCEMAQAWRRLGAAVTLIQSRDILPKDDPEIAEVVRRRLRREGVTLHEGTRAHRIARTPGGIRVETETATIEGSHLLVATGRRAAVERLGLETAGIEHSAKGITVDARLRTANRRVFAMGDATGGMQFTHVAGYHAAVVLKNALFHWPAKADHRAVPWVTYTEPEAAHVGETEAQAAGRLGAANLRILRFAVAENDRARTERAEEGLIKVVTDRRGRILGASIAASRAGDLILPWVMAVAGRQKIGAIAGAIAPYPTLSEISKRAAGTFFMPSLFSERTKRIVRVLQRF
ncbi:MAG: NAD(P)/FAD-dependent oxidoreductase [Alphaproteobacteria bacterium]